MERILRSLLKSVTGVSDCSQHTCSFNYDGEKEIGLPIGKPFLFLFGCM